MLQADQPPGATLPRLALMLVTDMELCGEREQLLGRLRGALAEGVNIVQLRERGLPAEELLGLAQDIREMSRSQALFLVNDRVDIALLSEADGVHLPEKGRPVQAARGLLGPQKLIGRSVHSLDAALAAEAAGADYVVLGSIFPTRSHPGETPLGLGLLKQVTQKISIPVIAIGGINSSNAGQVMQSGAWGVAAISALLAAQDTAKAARQLLTAVDKGARDHIKGSSIPL